MLAFKNSAYLYLLMIIPVIIIFYILMQLKRKELLKRFASYPIINKLTESHSQIKAHIKFGIIALALTLFIIALAGPLAGKMQQQSTDETRDIFLLLDISASMNCTDISPNRLSRAKRLIAEILGEMKGSRFSVIAYAGEAYMQMPLSTDADAANFFIETIDAGDAPTNGTAIGKAIALASKSMDKATESQSIALILSDGENFDDSPLDSAKAAVRNGLKIICCGVGTPDGAPVPVEAGSSRYFKGEDNKSAISRLNEKLLRNIAESSDGAYFNINNSFLRDSIVNRMKQVSSIPKLGSIEEVAAERYQYVLGFLLLLLLVEFVLTDKKKMRK